MSRSNYEIILASQNLNFGFLDFVFKLYPPPFVQTETNDGVVGQRNVATKRENINRMADKFRNIIQR